jgi:hypothetical protein
VEEPTVAILSWPKKQQVSSKLPLASDKVQKLVIELQDSTAGTSFSLYSKREKGIIRAELKTELAGTITGEDKDDKINAIVFFIENAEPLSKDGKTIDVDAVFATIEVGVKEVLVLLAKGEKVFIPANTAKVKDSVLLGNTLDVSDLKDVLVAGSVGNSSTNFFFKNVSENDGVLTFVVRDDNDDEDFTFKSNEFKKASDGTLYGENISLSERYYACPTKEGLESEECGWGDTQEQANAKVSKANFKGKITNKTTATIAFSGNTLDTPLRYSNFGYIKNEDDAHVTGDITIDRDNGLKHATVFSYGDNGKVQDFGTGAEFNGKAVTFVECQPESRGEGYGRQFNGEAKLNIGSGSGFEKTLTITLPEFGKITYVGDALPEFDQGASLTAGAQYDMSKYSGVGSGGTFTAIGYGESANNPSEAVGTFEYSGYNKSAPGSWDNDDNSIDIRGSFGVVKQ